MRANGSGARMEKREQKIHEDWERNESARARERERERGRDTRNPKTGQSLSKRGRKSSKKVEVGERRMI